MNEVGKADICLQYKHHQHYTTSLISSDVRFTILVAWHDLQPLHVFFEFFPACLCVTQHQLVQVFLDYLSDEPMNVPDMHTYVSENAVPY